MRNIFERKSCSVRSCYSVRDGGMIDLLGEGVFGLSGYQLVITFESFEILLTCIQVVFDYSCRMSVELMVSLYRQPAENIIEDKVVYGRDARDYTMHHSIRCMMSSSATSYLKSREAEP